MSYWLKITLASFAPREALKENQFEVNLHVPYG